MKFAGFQVAYASWGIKFYLKI